MACTCGHPRRSHKWGFPSPAGAVVRYRRCRKHDCDCRGYDPA